jgi:hypoxanthine phosphoribosyltransferase
VNSAVLVRKVHDRETTGELPAFIGMEVEDKYVFGCGMDVYEYWRQLDEIRALEE